MLALCSAVAFCPQSEWQAIDQGLEQILAEYTLEQVKATPYEDIHTFVEATLASKIGPAALKLHTGRSRNDQVATDFRLFVRKAIGLVLADIEALQIALVECGARNAEALIPAYTHLRRAQPIRWSHYCLAFVEMLGRDRERFEQSLGRVDILPLGSGAVAGSNFALDRAAIAKELEFSRISANSLDATCDRDFVLEFLVQCRDSDGTHQPASPRTGSSIRPRNSAFSNFRKRSRPAAA